MNRSTKSYRPGFDALEERALLTGSLLGQTLGGVSKPATAAAVQTTTSHDANKGTDEGIIAILIGL